jgi:hypothetical protein
VRSQRSHSSMKFRAHRLCHRPRRASRTEVTLRWRRIKTRSTSKIVSPPTRLHRRARRVGIPVEPAAAIAALRRAFAANRAAVPIPVVWRHCHRKPSLVSAQQPASIPTIGWLVFEAGEGWLDGFRRGLRGFGYVEGQNIAIEARSPQGSGDRLAEPIEELARLKVKIILTGGAQPPFARADEVIA